MEITESSLGSFSPDISLSAAPSYAYALGLTQFQGFWIPSRHVPTSSIISFQKYFQALDEDIIVVSKPKAGTTWLKALVFTIVNSANSHQLISFFDVDLYKENSNPDLFKIPSPRFWNPYVIPKVHQLSVSNSPSQAFF
ncbi:cytosolic sulfotransferase 15-like [Gossypium raimondii]|uniref:cytosolic sulfotransferase 15-like n=1 Tax=Gossypium raimondii TaxID=29730 RepID=UPI00227B2C85|nr:cytosolic sulfotransferase 15-like [Gossypium raimondii]